MSRPRHQYTDFGNWDKQYALMKSAQAKFEHVLVGQSPPTHNRALRALRALSNCLE